jgi:hypothetical protein
LSKAFEDIAKKRAILVKRADELLIASVHEMSRRLNLTRSSSDLVRDIKATMNITLPPYGLTVIQTLFERERAKAFNQCGAEQFPTVRKDFGNAIQDFVVVRDGRTPARTTRKIADRAWKWDHAADRRVLRAGSRNDTSTAYKGRPETYPPDLVWAFADAIARAAGRKRFSTGHHGDVAITDKNKGGGPMLRVLVAAMRWAMMTAWQMAAPPRTPPPAVSPEGILSLVKRGR